MRRTLFSVTLSVVLFGSCVSAPLRFLPEELPRFDASTAMHPLMVNAISRLSDQEAAEVDATYPRTHTFEAYRRLIGGEVDIIFSIEPNEELVEMARIDGVQFEYRAIGRDAFVFIVNKEHPVDGLTVEEIRSIYSGNTVNWLELGGADEEIVAFQRDHESGSQAIMENVVMAGLTMIEAPATRVNVGMGTMNERLSFDNSMSAIGYNIYYFTTYMHPNDKIKMLAVNGVAPNFETIQDQSYPFTGEIFAIIRADEEERSPTRQVLDWFAGPEGQEIVRNSGYVSLY